MTIVQSPQSWIKQTFFIGIIAALTACGGSGGGGNEPPIIPPDTTPNAFTLNVVADAEPGEDVVSEPITVGGINAPAAISVEGGQYSINDGDYTSSAGTVTNGQMVTVKVVASTSLETDSSATLNIGGVTSTFVVTTLADTTPPTAQITFPPPMSMKDSETILVRGVANDDYSGIKSLMVNDAEAEFSDDTNWTATVTLAEGENQLVVEVVDDADNVNETASSVVIHRAEEAGEFPDENNPITYGNHLTFDKANNRILVTNFEYVDGISAVIAVDLLTGVRTILSGPDTPNTENAFLRPTGIVVDADADRNRALVLDQGRKIIAVDLADGTRTLLSDGETPDDQQPILSAPANITLDPNDPNIAYIVDEDVPNVQKIDLASGKRTLVSDNSHEGIAFVAPNSILVDVENNRALVGDGDATTAALFSVDLETGDREVISDLENPQPGLPLYGARAMASDNLAEYVFFDSGLNGILKVNVNTGERESFFDPFSTSPANVVHSLYLEPGFSYLFYLDNRTQGVYAVDSKSAEYVVISKSQTPD
jgi:hypothetical protein